jgi:sialidase-1
MEGYAYYRSPALAIAANGYVLAFCEARKDSPADNGKIDIVVKRSKDNGLTWGKRHLVAADGLNTVGNPCPIVDSQTGTVCVVFCKNFANDTEEQILSGEKLPRSIWKVFSYDNGLTWTVPEKISPQVRLENWTWYATGPCHGIETKKGRYIIPCNHAELDNIPKNVTRSHVICSDDKGETWFIGGMCDWRTNEAAIAETEAGLYLNMKSNKFGATRAYAFSKDEGLSFTDCKYSELLADPYCQGSVKDYKNGILFCNANSEHKRENLTLRFSSDLCRHWKESLLLEKSFAGSSDIAVNNQNKILVLHEGMVNKQNDCVVLKVIEFD